MKADDDVIEREKLYTHPGYEFLTAHIDGRFRKSGKLLENKTTSAFYFKDNFGEPGTDQVPLSYQLQCQLQLMVTGASECILNVLVFPKRVDDWVSEGWTPTLGKDGKTWSLVGNGRKLAPIAWASTLDAMGYFHSFVITPNHALQDDMIAAAKDFWNVHIIGEEIPTAENYGDIRRKYREPVGTVVATDQLEEYSREYKDIGKEMTQISKRKDQLKTLLVQGMADGGAVVDKDSEDRWILRDKTGKKLHSFTKKGFR
jgi:hypothetical protein